MATIQMMRFSTDEPMPRSLAALLSVILILSAWMHAGTDHARDLSADIPVLVESGDSRLMVLPRQTLEQRSRDTDRSAGGPPEAFDAVSPASLVSSTPFAVLPVVRHGPPRTADPAAHPASPRAPPILSL